MKLHTPSHRRRHRTSTIAALAGAAPLARATPAQLAALAPYADIITVAPGTVIERSGRYARQFVQILDGAVDGVRDDGSTFTLPAGCGIGGVQLCFELAHAATFTAAQTTTLLVVHGPPMRRILRELERNHRVHPAGTAGAPVTSAGARDGAAVGLRVVSS